MTERKTAGSVPKALLTLRGAVDLMGKENARLRTKNRELRAKVKELKADAEATRAE